MNSKQNELQPPAQAGESREAGRVAGEPSGGGSRETDWPEASPVGGAPRGSAKHPLGVLHSSVDLWDSITHGERREGTCVDATKRRDGVVTAGHAGYQRQQSPESSTPASAGRRKPIGKRHSESRVRENRMHGLMRGGSWRTLAFGLSIRQLLPTLLLCRGAGEQPLLNKPG